MEKFGSGIRDKNPGSATLVIIYSTVGKFHSLSFQIRSSGVGMDSRVRANLYQNVKEFGTSVNGIPVRYIIWTRNTTDFYPPHTFCACQHVSLSVSSDQANQRELWTPCTMSSSRRNATTTTARSSSRRSCTSIWSSAWTSRSPTWPRRGFSSTGTCARASTWPASPVLFRSVFPVSSQCWGWSRSGSGSAPLDYRIVRKFYGWIQNDR